METVGLVKPPENEGWFPFEDFRASCSVLFIKNVEPASQMSLAQFHSFFTLLSLNVIAVTLGHALEQNWDFTSLCKTRVMLLNYVVYPENPQTELFWEGCISACIICIFKKDIMWYHETKFTEDEESIR